MPGSGQSRMGQRSSAEFPDFGNSAACNSKRRAAEFQKSETLCYQGGPHALTAHIANVAINAPPAVNIACTTLAYSFADCDRWANSTTWFSAEGQKIGVY